MAQVNASIGGFLFPISWTTVKGKSWALSITMGPCECRVPIELLLNGWIWMETTQYVHSVQRLGTFANLSPHTQVNCYKNTGAPISIPSSIKFNCPNFPHISWGASNPQFNHSPFFHPFPMHHTPPKCRIPVSQSYKPSENLGRWPPVSPQSSLPVPTASPGRAELVEIPSLSHEKWQPSN